MSLGSVNAVVLIDSIRLIHSALCVVVYTCARQTKSLRACESKRKTDTMRKQIMMKNIYTYTYIKSNHQHDCVREDAHTRVYSAERYTCESPATRSMLTVCSRTYSLSLKRGGDQRDRGESRKRSDIHACVYMYSLMKTTSTKPARRKSHIHLSLCAYYTLDKDMYCKDAMRILMVE